MLQKFLQSPEHAKALAGRNVLVLSGELRKQARIQTIKQMKENKKVIAFVTFGVGAVGHNFQEFAHMIIADRCWNPQVTSLLCLFYIIIILVQKKKRNCLVLNLS